MSIEVESLTKVYGSQKAIDGLTFNVQKGDILGFLGPNGAGKTTTMKILTCFMPQSTGSAKICGIDTREDSLAVRKRIGYLPESNPLYKEMYIKEYLSYIARIYGLKNIKNRVAEMIDITGLGREQNKKISEISKGYKQRVGLAQAMIHDPDVLIMDEPTSGLDPNQLVEIRQVIRDIGKDKAVILSSHIMQEVEALCNRVIIINQGKKIIDDKINALANVLRGEQIISIEFVNAPTDIDKVFGSNNSIIRIEKTGKNTVDIYADKKSDIREQIFDTAVRNNLKIIGMSQNQASVEEVFHQLTIAN
jgi:ABC-2 type transport system ATP-binding protein